MPKMVTVQEVVAEAGQPLSKLDQLRVKRAEIAREYKRVLGKYDRQIALVAASHAEEIMAEAEELLADV